MRWRALASVPGTRSDEVERMLAAMFPGAEPVLLSSGRAALAMVLEIAGLRRADTVLVPPYASHCVLEAVARVATPAPAGVAPGAAVVYHQWGFVQEGRAPAALVIEDACDSLCSPGARLLPLGGRFEIWSLPKILGCAAGGVAWCRDPDDAARLREARGARRRGAMLQLCLRLLGQRFPSLHTYWAGRESLGGHLPALGVASVREDLRHWGAAVAARRARLQRLQRFLPSWLRPDTERLPCVVPIAAHPGVDHAVQGLAIGLRHLERVHPDGRIELVPVYPVAIHADADDAGLDRAARALDGLGLAAS